MINLLFLLTLLIAVPSHADGPKYRHAEPNKQLEFENVYQDIRNIQKVSTSTYILNSTSPQTGTFNVNSATITILDTGNIKRNGVVVSSFTNAGEITQPLQPCFLVTNSAGATDVTGDGTSYTVSWGNEVYDPSNDIANSTFTAPVTGKYLLTAHVFARGLTTAHNASFISIVTTAREYRDTWINSAGSVITGIPLKVTAIADMTAGDTATVILNVSGSTKVVDVDNDAKQNYFSGTLLN